MFSVHAHISRGLVFISFRVNGHMFFFIFCRFNKGKQALSRPAYVLLWTTYPSRMGSLFKEQIPPDRGGLFLSFKSCLPSEAAE